MSHNVVGCTDILTYIFTVWKIFNVGNPIFKATYLEFRVPQRQYEARNMENGLHRCF